MSYPKKSENRDEVLFAFQQDCEQPTAEQIIAWVSRFPQFAEDIRAHAAVAWDWAMRELGPVDTTADEPLAAQCYSQALNIIFNREHPVAVTSETKPQKTFHEMISDVGKDIPGLARELNIGRSVVADLFNGWMLAPVGRRLVDAVVSALGITQQAFDAALQSARQTPLLGHAKADKAPAAPARSYDEIIRTSSMPPERKRYWLEED